ncbi:methyltransferase, partial [Cellulosimicrobium cellulans]|uniref:methyltransferase n=1 Tax=Cellulosimicrobium cellulans TaxID=1710 RepID=UPI0036E18385
VKAIEIPTNPIQQQIKKLENEVKLSKIPGFFPTPNNIVQRMIEFADIKDGETILEPSAGNGNILDGISQYIMEEGLNVNLEALEWNHKLSEILELKQYKIVGNDFTEFIPNTLYDKIIMNPPFEKNQDIVHVLKAYDCLKDGGKLVSIMSPHWTFANDSKSVQFREWLSDKGTFEKLPEGSFKESGTGVNTVLVVIEKPVEVKPETESIQEPIVYPEIEINDLDQYAVSDDLQNRLHSASMFQVDYKRDCKVTFESIQNEALEVLSLTDNDRIKHNIKKYLQSFKKRYYEMYLKMLNHRANNPGWMVTGRGGINVRRYNKKQEQYANMINRASEMMN